MHQTAEKGVGKVKFSIKQILTKWPAAGKTKSPPLEP
jgi:hypothetical protein